MEVSEAFPGTRNQSPGGGLANRQPHLLRILMVLFVASCSGCQTTRPQGYATSRFQTRVPAAAISHPPSHPTVRANPDSNATPLIAMQAPAASAAVGESGGELNASEIGSQFPPSRETSHDMVICSHGTLCCKEECCIN
jgi:hypothetical protein